MGQCSMLKSSKIFSNTITCLNFNLLDLLFFELSCTKRHTDRQADKNTDIHGHVNSIVAVHKYRFKLPSFLLNDNLKHGFTYLKVDKLTSVTVAIQLLYLVV